MRRAAVLALLAGLAGVVACRNDMGDQPKFKPLARNGFFPDDRASRPLVEDTVPRTPLRSDVLLETGKLNGAIADVFPFPVTAQVLERGQQRFNIFCSVCHGLAGYGDGMVVQRGFKRPPSFHVDRLRQAPAGHYFDVMTNGFGAMYDYRARISPEDRWAIVAYIRALQLSQHSGLADVPDKERAKLEGGAQ